MRLHFVHPLSTHTLVPQQFPVTRWTLHLDALPSAAAELSPSVRWKDEVSPQEYLRLYTAVGEPWGWFDRRLLDESGLTAILQQPRRLFAVFEVDGDAAGFAELCQHEDSVEIAYFGLIPECTGRGLGKALFREVVTRATELANGRTVWLTTCSWDSPAARPFYARMGFKEVREETIQQRVPDGFDPPANA